MLSRNTRIRLYINDNGKDKLEKLNYNKSLSNYHQIDEYKSEVTHVQICQTISHRNVDIFLKYFDIGNVP